MRDPFSTSPLVSLGPSPPSHATKLMQMTEVLAAVFGVVVFFVVIALCFRYKRHSRGTGVSKEISIKVNIGEGWPD